MASQKHAPDLLRCQRRRRALRALAGLGALAALQGCGFQLRQAPVFSFASIYVDAPGSALGAELQRQLRASGLQVLTDAAAREKADLILQSLADQRERQVLGLNASGQVREYRLHVRFRFRVRTPAGKDVLPDAEIVRQIDQSYSETAALSKEAEAQMLFDNMQSDIVLQVMRRLSTVKP
ncbi:MAG: LPS assembly lipoprotein LptE [Burkholderiaceae bacterium]|jgi:LPS-assembly lipoprotein|nr:LPS assembly lipoprotein LptE [Burkholderiaceae bacterium]